MSIAEIIESLEKASGPSRYLDKDIHIIVGLAEPGAENYGPYLYRKMACPRYTESVDAAIALCEAALPGAKISLFVNHLTSAKDESGARATVHRKKGPKCPYTGIRWPACQGECFHSKTAPLAICIALLKAKEAEDERIKERRIAA
ncbi:hypothetical protein ATY75_11955 [Rhizobium sp. N122]|uniref:hypothetical protein n=1 Tax=Rhizobium sp. N122 TaxID=1764272 RepID=UPI000B5A5132|nr:hypothetical protein [Rhizobium sp. N122]OWV62534.1 hypothetical protein ATY75_11955 [Rhizobium sp. N122]